MELLLGYKFIAIMTMFLAFVGCLQAIALYRIIMRVQGDLMNDMRRIYIALFFKMAATFLLGLAGYFKYVDNLNFSQIYDIGFSIRIFALIFIVYAEFMFLRSIVRIKNDVG